jgi:hypothetical protein
LANIPLPELRPGAALSKWAGSFAWLAGGRTRVGRKAQREVRACACVGGACQHPAQRRQPAARSVSVARRGLSVAPTTTGTQLRPTTTTQLHPAQAHHHPAQASGPPPRSAPPPRSTQVRATTRLRHQTHGGSDAHHPAHSNPGIRGARRLRLARAEAPSAALIFSTTSEAPTTTQLRHQAHHPAQASSKSAIPASSGETNRRCTR